MTHHVGEADISILESAHPPSPLTVVILNRPLPPAAAALPHANRVFIVDGAAERLLEYLRTSRSSLDPEVEDAALVREFVNQAPGRRHILLGDLDSVKAETRAAFAVAGIPVIETPGQDTNDLEKALEILREEVEKNAWILILGGLDGRLDHTFCNIHALLRHHQLHPNTLICSHESLCFVVPCGIWDIKIPQCSLRPSGCGLLPLREKAKVTTVVSF